MDVREPSAQSWRVKSLRVDEQREEGTDCGGNVQWREHVSVYCWWSVRVGED